MKSLLSGGTVQGSTSYSIGLSGVGTYSESELLSFELTVDRDKSSNSESCGRKVCHIIVLWLGMAKLSNFYYRRSLK